MGRRKSTLILLLAGVLTLVSAGASGESRESNPARDRTERVSFIPEERQRIDEGALWGPREKHNLAPVEAYGNALKWLVARTPLPFEEEGRRAARKDEELRTKHKTSEAPPEAQLVFDKLVKTLPTLMRPKGIEFTLTLVEKSEADAFTLGAGRVYVGDKFLKSVLEDGHSEKDQLAFVLAHELGHLCLGHARRFYQRMWLNDQVKKDLEAKKTQQRGAGSENPPNEEADERRKLDDERARVVLEAVAAAGVILEYVYFREEQFQADLFAIQLCRNAGYDLENCLDVLRRVSVKEDSSLLQAHPRREGFPPVESELQPQITGEEITLASPPTAMQRLRRLRLELDGLIYGDTFGLFEFDRATKTLGRAADRCVPDEGRVVVCIHGMESSLGVYLPLMNRLAADSSAANFRVLGFQYPNDESLARAGRFLKREVERVCISAKNIDFVCHSAGGLVFRDYAEVENGSFHRAYFLGTPHRGSDLASLRSLLEASQFIGDLNLGFDGALQKAILDGHGQIGIDLQSDSLFLSHLNAPRDNLSRKRYVIYRGQAFSRTRVVLLKAAVDAARASLDRALKNDALTVTKFGRATLEKLILPAEIANGDLVVTLENAILDGVETIYTHSLRHTDLPKNSAVIEHLVKLLVDEK